MAGFKDVQYLTKVSTPLTFISLLINTRGVTKHLRQNTDTWFTRMRQYFNTIFKKFSTTKYLSFNYKK